MRKVRFKKKGLFETGQYYCWFWHLSVRNLTLKCSWLCSCVKLHTPKKKKERKKKPIFSPPLHPPPSSPSGARSRTRVHVWQLHVDILPAAYRVNCSALREKEKGKKRRWSPQDLRALQVRRWTSAAVKSAEFCIAICCSGLQFPQLVFFLFLSLFFLNLLWNTSCCTAAVPLVSTYIRYSMTCTTFFHIL